jgi:hypothetical protein
VDEFENLLRDVWGELLSGEPNRVRIAFGGLEKTEQQAVLAHLKEMAEGEGWQEGQRESAQVALKVIKP